MVDLTVTGIDAQSLTSSRAIAKLVAEMKEEARWRPDLPKKLCRDGKWQDIADPSKSGEYQCPRSVVQNDPALCFLITAVGGRAGVIHISR